MAAEYSRDLSDKTYAGQRRASSFGYLTNRWTPLGMRRLAIDHRGQPVRVLQLGEYRLRGCRVSLVPGPDDEVALVRRIFRLFGQRGWTQERIATRLNKEGLRNPHSKTVSQAWIHYAVRNLLKCEAYIGNHVYGKTTMRLGAGQSRVPREAWGRAEGVFEPIVSRRLFHTVQRLLGENEAKTDAVLLADLRALFAKHGHLTSHMLRAHPGMSRASTYAKRFGSLAEAYRLAGYAPRNAKQAAALTQGTQCRRNRLTSDVAEALRAAGCEVVIDWRRSRLSTDRGLIIDVRACRPRYEPLRNWAHHTKKRVKAPLTLIARLDDELEPMDYCLLTLAGFGGGAGIYLPAKLQCRAGLEILTSLDRLYEHCLRLSDGQPAVEGRATDRRRIYSPVS